VHALHCARVAPCTRCTVHALHCARVAPCTRCTVEIIQAGITDVVSFPPQDVPSKWHEDLAVARGLLSEAGVKYREISEYE